MAHVFLLALAAAIYPTLLAGFLLGGMVISVAAGVVIVSSFRASGVVGPSNHTTRPVLDIAAGVASLGVAWAIWRRRLVREIPLVFYLVNEERARAFVDSARHGRARTASGRRWRWPARWARGSW